MMFSNYRSLLILSSILFLTTQVKSEVVCSEDELVKELIEDIRDNGKLDCLRESSPMDAATETDHEKALRIAANWDGDCSFESETPQFHWKTRLENYYGITKGLVNAEGMPVEDDAEDQADMCEIVRTLIANSKFYI